MTEIQLKIIDHSPGNWIARITIDNSRKLNILDSAAMEHLRSALDVANEDDGIRAIVLTGAGKKAFIGGADIREMVTLQPNSAEHFITCLHRACNAARKAPVPVIASINGYCLGAGLELAASCDLRIASANAVFGMPEVKVGLPSVIEAALLPRLIGWGRTNRLLYSGESIDAEQALQWGLVEQVVTSSKLADATASLVDAIVTAGPQAIRAQKQLIRQWETLSLEDSIRQGILAFRETYRGDEPRRLMRSFLERKRR